MSIIHVNPEEKEDASVFKDKETNTDLEIQEEVLLVEWLANHYKDFGTNLEFVTDSSEEGHQFVRGFGGIGGVLRYQVDFGVLDDMEDLDDDDEWDLEEDFM